jgi:replicative DNA helicase
MTKFSDLLVELIPEERIRLAIDRKYAAYAGKMLKLNATNKEMLAEHLYQTTPKNDLLAEEQFIARLILFPTEAFPLLSRLGKVEEVLFYSPRLKVVFSLINHLYNTRQHIHIEAVINELRGAGVLEQAGGEEYLRTLIFGITSSAGLEEYAQTVIACYECRLVWDLCSCAISDTQHIKPSEATAYREELISKLTLLSELHIDSTTICDGKKQASMLSQARKEAKDRLASGNVIEHPCHLTELNEFMGGWGKGNMVVVAARPSMGKTSFAIADMLNALKNGEPCLFVSLEMTVVELLLFMFGMEYNILNAVKKMKTCSFSAEEDQLLDEFETKLEGWGGYFLGVMWDDAKKQYICHDTVKKIKAAAQWYFAKKGIKRIYIDYLQLMKHEDNHIQSNEFALISANSSGVKRMSLELQIPVMLISQLNRDLEKRPSKRPQISDLRGSGSIEQDANDILLLFRPEWYGILENEDGEDLRGLGEIIIGKHRGGALDTIKAWFNAPCVKWDDLANKDADYENPTNIFLEEISKQAQPKTVQLEISPSSSLEFTNLDD